MAKAHTHGKAPLTGKGQEVKAPMGGGKGPSNHVPTVGKTQPKQNVAGKGYFSVQQQQQTDNK